MAWLQEKLKAIEEAEKQSNELIGGFIGDYGSDFGGGGGSGGGGNSGYTGYNPYGKFGEPSPGTYYKDEWDYLDQMDAYNTGGYTGVFADTGLYTGEWDGGSVRRNGRLAWLHQKELVLNAHDTENFLDAMNIVRQLDNLTSWMANGLGDLFTNQLKDTYFETELLQLIAGKENTYVFEMEIPEDHDTYILCDLYPDYPGGGRSQQHHYAVPCSGSSHAFR